MLWEIDSIAFNKETFGSLPIVYVTSGGGNNSNFTKRREKIFLYWFLIKEYKEKKILTKENKNLIEKFNIEYFWFEKR